MFFEEVVKNTIAILDERAVSILVAQGSAKLRDFRVGGLKKMALSVPACLHKNSKMYGSNQNVLSDIQL